MTMDARANLPLRVVLIEDSAVLRDLLSAILGGISTLEIVDLELKAGTGLGILAAIHAVPERFGSPRAIVFSNHSHPAVRARCQALGVAAFFDKSFQMDELLSYMDGAAGQGAPVAV
jgi:CheY-like chemotaxis protein